MRWVKECLKVLPLGIVLPIVIGAASVKPDDAISNLGAWAKHLGVADVPQWLSNPTFDNKAIAGAVFFAIVYAILIYGVPYFRKIGWGIWDRRRASPADPKSVGVFSTALAPTDPEFISMKEAATQAYTKLRSTSWAQFANGYGETNEGKLRYYAAALAGEIPIFGRSPPSTEHDEIPQKEFREGQGLFKCGGTEYWRHDDTDARWKDLRVRGSDLRRAIELIKAEDEFVPLKDAIATVYDRLLDSDSIWALAAEKLGKTNTKESREQWVRGYLANAFVTLKVPIYGRKPPGMDCRLIDHNEFRRGGFDGAGTSFIYHLEKTPVYTDLAIKKVDLDKAIERMKHFHV